MTNRNTIGLVLLLCVAPKTPRNCVCVGAHNEETIVYQKCLNENNPLASYNKFSHRCLRAAVKVCPNAIVAGYEACQKARERETKELDAYLRRHRGNE